MIQVVQRDLFKALKLLHSLVVSGASGRTIEHNTRVRLSFENGGPEATLRIAKGDLPVSGPPNRIGMTLPVLPPSGAIPRGDAGWSVLVDIRTLMAAVKPDRDDTRRVNIYPPDEGKLALVLPSLRSLTTRLPVLPVGDYPVYAYPSIDLLQQLAVFAAADLEPPLSWSAQATLSEEADTTSLKTLHCVRIESIEDAGSPGYRPAMIRASDGHRLHLSRVVEQIRIGAGGGSRALVINRFSATIIAAMCNPIYSRGPDRSLISMYLAPDDYLVVTSRGAGIQCDYVTKLPKSDGVTVEMAEPVLRDPDYESRTMIQGEAEACRAELVHACRLLRGSRIVTLFVQGPRVQVLTDDKDIGEASMELSSLSVAHPSSADGASVSVNLDYLIEALPASRTGSGEVQIWFGPGKVNPIRVVHLHPVGATSPDETWMAVVMPFGK